MCIFRAVIFKEKEIHYISVYCLENENYPYKLTNNCKNFLMSFRQIDMNSNEINVPLELNPMSSLPFAWPFPNKPSEIEINFCDIKRPDNILLRIVYNLTRLQHKSRKFKIKNMPMVEIEAKYVINGPTIILEFGEKGKMEREKAEEGEDLKKFFLVFFKEFGISLIAKNKFQKNVELSYLYFKVIL